MHLLRRFPLFVDIPEEDLASLASQVCLRDYRPDEVIFYQGNLADCIWLAWQGRVLTSFALAAHSLLKDKPQEIS